MAERWRLRKGDKVMVIAGKKENKNAVGDIIQVDRKNRRVMVRGINMVKRHMKPSMGNPGSIVEKEAYISASNVMLLDPETNLPTRVGIRFNEDGTKVRVAKRSGKVIDNK